MYTYTDILYIEVYEWWISVCCCFRFTVWSVDSSEVPLISGGSQKEVQVDELSTYLKLALEFRKSELDNQVSHSVSSW